MREHENEGFRCWCWTLAHFRDLHGTIRSSLDVSIACYIYFCFFGIDDCWMASRKDRWMDTY